MHAFETENAPLLQPHSLCDVIAARLREQILDHTLEPGHDINEMELVRHFGVSRTPIREALKVLHSEGLLTAQARRGMVVTQLQESERLHALRLYQLLQNYAKAQCVESSIRKHERIAQPALQKSPLLTKVQMTVERQLRLAYGKAFEQEMAKAIGPDAL
ncbi:GntR family transcriptional regulator [Lampropedia puyangensis]|uniref:GntR family transcriptional regulator n=1 Tax=Lampropedia puyangensis TaxID=1330072 RepID=A0A4S8F587_9BURK|nr:GntR family transcriptional regulator [Lampropedia puyangensis]THU02001.1 GntR family transcriptional regulator [Lampropedia puyangensis]